MARGIEMIPLTVQEAISHLAAGRFVIIVDDEDRDNEGDLCAAAEAVTPEHISFMARRAGGLICARSPTIRASSSG